METNLIGKYIPRLRKNAGMTQKDLAEKLNISFQAVSKWENGDTLPDTGILLSLYRALNTTADKLLSGGNAAETEGRQIRLGDVVTGFQYLEKIGELFGVESSF